VLPAHAASGGQPRRQSPRGRSARRCQDDTAASERRDSGRERGRKRANLLPVVAQPDLDAGQLLDVAADGSSTGRCDLLLRQEALGQTLTSPSASHGKPDIVKSPSAFSSKIMDASWVFFQFCTMNLPSGASLD